MEQVNLKLKQEERLNVKCIPYDVSDRSLRNAFLFSFTEGMGLMDMVVYKCIATLLSSS